MDDNQLARLASEISQDDSQHETYAPQTSGAKRPHDDGAAQPQQRAKRNRYISLACNEVRQDAMESYFFVTYPFSLETMRR